MSEPGINLSKVTLSQSAPSISLAKSSGASGRMRINLNWSQPPARGGLFRRKESAADLDLACLWELKDGTKGVVQALGNSFGSLTSAPFIQLDGDDRSGQNTGGENMTVNLDRLDSIARILVFTYIYEGVPNWAAADAVVTLHPQDGAPIEVRLDATSDSARTCAIAMLTNEGGSLGIRREVRYVDGSQSDLDRAYGWGMNWKAGRK